MNMGQFKSPAARRRKPIDRTLWRAGWRVIGGQRAYYRSRWEANYARVLDFLKRTKVVAEWRHEPKTFWFDGIKRGVCSYLPDFEVVYSDGRTVFVEVKGYMDARSRTKLRRMKKYHPGVTVRLVGAKEYRSLEKKLSFLPGWE